MESEFSIDELEDLEQACQQMLSFWADNYKEQVKYFKLVEKIQHKLGR